MQNTARNKADKAFFYVSNTIGIGILVISIIMLIGKALQL